MLITQKELKAEKIGSIDCQLIVKGEQESKRKFMDWLLTVEEKINKAKDLVLLSQELFKNAEEIKGINAFVLIYGNYQQIIAVSIKSSLLIGFSEKGNYLAWELEDLLPYTKQCSLISNGEICILASQKVLFFDASGQEVSERIFQIDIDQVNGKKQYEHYMLKEICEQPQVFRTILGGRLSAQQVTIEGIGFSSEEVNNWHDITIIACGTSYHAGLIGKEVLERLLNLPVSVEIASEFAYRNPLVNEQTLVIAISQSGETADTLAALRKAKQKDARLLALTNTLDSTIGREADYSAYIWAGPEIAIASTKAFSATLLSLYLLAINWALLKKTIDEIQLGSLIKELMKLPIGAEKILENLEQYQDLSWQYHHLENAYFVGRGLDWPIALEGALKLKETSYIHAEGYSSGEFKHGSIALISEGTLIIAICLERLTYSKVLSNIQEYQAHGARVLALAFEGDQEVKKYTTDILYLPRIEGLILPILSVIPLQLLAYYFSKAKGRPIDQPRNLVKSIQNE